jgi:hypothetical protein
VSTQVEPHMDDPASALQTHAPPTQLAEAPAAPPQAWPHVPQLLTSVCRSVQRPLQREMLPVPESPHVVSPPSVGVPVSDASSPMVTSGKKLESPPLMSPRGLVLPLLLLQATAMVEPPVATIPPTKILPSRRYVMAQFYRAIPSSA